MTTAVQNLLHSFDALSDSEKGELASEILRRSLKISTPQITDEQFMSAADDLFLRLDREETQDA